MERFLLTAAGVNGLLAVALGAFGAHGLKSSLAGAADAAQRLEWWETAARYQMYHALALGLLAWLASRIAWGGLAVGGWAFLAGIVLFSGSLYAMTLTGVRALGAVTPVGGLGLIVGWVVVVLAALRMGRG
ncbi:DUF423 domain-containing protein [bacterium]|nr:DUF423 domain-containing protein [bacterium]